MTSCLLTTVRALFGADAQYLGQGDNGVAKISLGGGRLISFYPMQASTNSNLSADIHLNGSNALNIGTSCGNFNLTPALSNLGDFGSVLNRMGLKADISSQGLITLTAGDKVYVARPEYLTSTGSPTTPNLSQGADGLYRFTDSAGHVQIFRPAFLDVDALSSQVQLALSLLGWAVIQIDGTALFTTLNGQQYVLTPDLTLTAAPAAHSADYWWQDGPNHYLYRSNLLTQGQGFTVQKR